MSCAGGVDVPEDCLYEMAWQTDGPLAARSCSVASDDGHNQRFALRSGHTVSTACGVLQLMQCAQAVRTHQMRIGSSSANAGLAVGSIDATEQVAKLLHA